MAELLNSNGDSKKVWLHCDWFKGQAKSKWFFQAEIYSKKWTNEFDFTTMIAQVDLLSYIFWKKLKTQKRHFKINWPLVYEIASGANFIKSFVSNDKFICIYLH